MKYKKTIPPKLAQKFLRCFLKEELAEEVEGDLEEQFSSRLEESSLWKAKLNYWYEVINYLRPFALRFFKTSNINFLAMFRHNLLISFRNFKRYKSSFLINLTGLSTGLACVFLIYLWVNDELKFDKFHEKDAQIFTVLEHRVQSGKKVLFWSTSGPTADALKEEFPEIIAATTDKNGGNATLTIGEKNVQASGHYVGQDFFKIFSFPLLQGDADQVLADKNSIVISDELAMRIFGTTENVVGKTIEWQHEREFQVSGVFEKMPLNSSIQKDFVLSFEMYQENNEWVTNWMNTSPNAYVLLQAGTDVDQLNEKLANFVQEKTNNEVTHRTMFVAKFSDLYLYGNYENGVQAGGRIEYVKLFSIVAAFILLIACINFMNLSTARASRRMKEVGIKKTVGAKRSSLISQYLSESLSISFLALIVAFVLVNLLLPQFNEITGKQLTFTYTPNVLLSAFGITAVTGFLAGSYPAIYLSSFNPGVVLKGKLNRSVGELWTRKGLVVIQFVLSVVLIVSVLVVYKQIEYVQNKNLGYNKENIIYFRDLSKDESNLESFISELKDIPGVKNATSIGHSLSGHDSGTYGIEWEGRDPNDKTEFENVAVNYDAIELIGVEMKEGRTFSREFSTDTAKIIFNEKAIEYMGFTDNPIGKVIKLWGLDREIIGVAKDFHFESLREEIKPLFFRLRPLSTWNIMVKVQGGSEQEVISNLANISEKFYPGFPFDYKFLDDQYQSMYEAEKRVAKLSRYFAGLAVIISCLGLFGLSAFTAERRIKEIGIRKVLGANIFSIVYLLSIDFTKMVLTAILIALPISYFVAAEWLQNFEFSVSLKWWYFAGAGIIAMLIAWFTVGIQTIKAAGVNPVKSLKSE